MTPTLASDADHTGRDLGGEERPLLREAIESGTLNGPRGDVATYRIVYKFGMLVEIGLVWPFQLAGPALVLASFPIFLATKGFVAPGEWESLRRGVSRLPPFASEKLS
ncbi:MAG: hypothetical protein P8R42_18590 [Candidatus Binatia bacterium]|nr:hypothetical protein [Candidatus Binatia bacterium]